MNPDALIHLLLGMRSQIDAALTMLQQTREPEECPHPPEKRKNLSTMGFERWQCVQCGHLHESKL